MFHNLSSSRKLLFYCSPFVKSISFLPLSIYEVDFIFYFLYNYMIIRRMLSIALKYCCLIVEFLENRMLFGILNSGIYSQLFEPDGLVGLL